MVNSVIMVLTDGAGLRRMIKETLEGFSFTVFAPETYDEAMATLKRETPALVVIDWMFDGIGAIMIPTQFRLQQSATFPVKYAWLLPFNGLNRKMVDDEAGLQGATCIYKAAGFTNAILRLAQA